MASGRFFFENFALDPADRQLRRDDVVIELNARYFDALALLVREQGKLVSKDRFLEEVWRGIAVTDEALTQCIKTIRRQLGDSANRPRFIETVPKHGYRFIASVNWVLDEVAAAEGAISAATAGGTPYAPSGTATFKAPLGTGTLKAASGTGTLQTTASAATEGTPAFHTLQANASATADRTPVSKTAIGTATFQIPSETAMGTATFQIPSDEGATGTVASPASEEGATWPVASPTTPATADGTPASEAARGRSATGTAAFQIPSEEGRAGTVASRAATGTATSPLPTAGTAPSPTTPTVAGVSTMQAARNAATHYSWQQFFILGGAGTLGGGLAGLLGGVFYGFAGFSQSLQSGMGAMSVLLVIVFLSILMGLAGGAGISFGIAAANFAPDRPWQWSILGGAVGGMIVGAFVKMLGLDAFNLLLGQSPGDITGAGEGALLGAAVGFALWLGHRRMASSMLKPSVITATLAGGIVSILIYFIGGRLMGGSLDLLANSFPNSRFRLDQVGAVFGESGFGPISQIVTGAFEGALFSGCIVGAMLVVLRRLNVQSKGTEQVANAGA